MSQQDNSKKIDQVVLTHEQQLEMIRIVSEFMRNLSPEEFMETIFFKFYSNTLLQKIDVGVQTEETSEKDVELDEEPSIHLLADDSASTSGDTIIVDDDMDEGHVDFQNGAPEPMDWSAAIPSVSDDEVEVEVEEEVSEQENKINPWSVNGTDDYWLNCSEGPSQEGGEGEVALIVLSGDENEEEEAAGQEAAAERSESPLSQEVDGVDEEMEEDSTGTDVYWLSCSKAPDQQGEEEIEIIVLSDEENEDEERKEEAAEPEAVADRSESALPQEDDGADEKMEEGSSEDIAMEVEDDYEEEEPSGTLRQRHARVEGYKKFASETILLVLESEDIESVRQPNSETVSFALDRLLFEKVLDFTEEFGEGQLALMPSTFFQSWSTEEGTFTEEGKKCWMFNTPGVQRYLVPVLMPINGSQRAQHYVLLHISLENNVPVVVIFDSVFYAVLLPIPKVKKFAALLFGEQFNEEDVEVISAGRDIIAFQGHNGCGIETIRNAEFILRKKEFDPYNLECTGEQDGTSDAHRDRLADELECLFQENDRVRLEIYQPKKSVVQESTSTSAEEKEQRPRSSKVFAKGEIITLDDDKVLEEEETEKDLQEAKLVETSSREEDEDVDHQEESIDETVEAVEDEVDRQSRSLKRERKSPESSEPNEDHPAAKKMRKELQPPSDEGQVPSPSPQLPRKPMDAEEFKENKLSLIDEELQEAYRQLPAMTDWKIEKASLIPKRINVGTCIFCRMQQSPLQWDTAILKVPDHLIRCGFVNVSVQCEALFHFSCISIAQPLHGFDAQYLGLDRNIGKIVCCDHYCGICFSDGYQYSATQNELVKVDDEYRSFHKSCIPAGSTSTNNGALEVFDFSETALFTGPHAPLCSFCWKEDKEEILVECGTCVNSFHANCTKNAEVLRCRRCLMNEQVEVGKAILIFHDNTPVPGICTTWEEIEDQENLRNHVDFGKIGFSGITILPKKTTVIQDLRTIIRIPPQFANKAYITMRSWYNGQHAEVLEALKESLSKREAQVPMCPRPDPVLRNSFTFHESSFKSPCYGSAMSEIAATWKPIPISKSIMLTPSVPPKGRGIVAIENIKKGDVLVEFVGEFIPEIENQKRKLLSERNEVLDLEGAHYSYDIEIKYKRNDDADEVWHSETGALDGAVQHNIASFINHSCEPNVKTDDSTLDIWDKKKTVQVERIQMISIRDIGKGEELTTDYGWDSDSFICWCKTPSCKNPGKEDWNL